MLGTIVNFAAILAGSGLGLALGPILSAEQRTTSLQGIGLAVLWIGGSLAWQSKEQVLTVVALVLGAIIGEGLLLETAIESLEERWRTRNDGAQGFVLATLIFTVGPMAILGSLNDGLNGDPALLYTKATLDGITSLMLSGTFGWPVLLAALPVLLYQGAITLLAGELHSVLSTSLISVLDGVGGLLILGIGLNMVNYPALKGGAWIWTPPQFQKPFQAPGFGFYVRPIRAC